AAFAAVTAVTVARTAATLVAFAARHLLVVAVDGFIALRRIGSRGFGAACIRFGLRRIVAAFAAAVVAVATIATTVPTRSALLVA
ncbi:hypothetical protein, partial [Variovorax sp. Varisp62]|uniref:hypothetical protein n=1 Tax=Variovorax sp. Varisp62 TaxID=3243049 RepID=UPI0039B43A57